MNQVMFAAIDGLTRDQRPPLDGLIEKLTARGLVHAAQVCLMHAKHKATKPNRQEIDNLAELLAQHVRTPLGAVAADDRRSFQRDLPHRIELDDTRGALRVALLASLTVRAELEGDDREGLAAAAEAAQLTSKLLREQPAPLKAFLHDLREALTAPPAAPAPKPRPAPDALLGLVYAAPHDAELRRVVADRLLEAADPRGVFVALQHAEQNDTTRAQISALLESHRDAWLGPLRSAVRDATFERGFVDTVQLGVAVDATLGLAEWATVRELTFGPQGRPKSQSPTPFALRLLAGDTLRSLISVRGINDIVLQGLSVLPLALKLEELGVFAENGNIEDVRASLARFVSLKTLAVKQPAQHRWWHDVNVERLELLELIGVPLIEVIALSGRVKRLHVRGEMSSRLPDLFFERNADGTRTAWLNLGTTGMSREEILGLALDTDWSQWASVKVYAKSVLPNEVERLERFRQLWPGRAHVTKLAADAPKVGLIL